MIVDGCTKVVILSRNDMPDAAVEHESMFRGLVRQCIKPQKVALPQVLTPHTLRHAFCTTVANAGMNLKAEQSFTGHSNIYTALMYYARMR
jgi:Site-specific recombinase XerD